MHEQKRPLRLYIQHRARAGSNLDVDIGKIMARFRSERDARVVLRRHLTECEDLILADASRDVRDAILLDGRRFGLREGWGAREDA